MPSIIKSCHKKNLLYKKYLKDLIMKESYTFYKNTLTKIIKTRKKLYYETFINANKNNSRTIWQHLNKKLGLPTEAKNVTLSTDLHALNTFFSEQTNYY